MTLHRLILRTGRHPHGGVDVSRIPESIVVLLHSRESNKLHSPAMSITAIARIALMREHPERHALQCPSADSLVRRDAR